MAVASVKVGQIVLGHFANEGKGCKTPVDGPWASADLLVLQNTAVGGGIENHNDILKLSFRWAGHMGQEAALNVNVSLDLTTHTVREC